ncbi:DUF4368 domain-containing protein [Criibacterium bergeronii]|uniref:DUF4368 domain-containing protein n=1 Tax=Criibacterium bergeronii TaxID=1871336 RepID=A0A552UV78_9FIRM|nr:DUF4368 domain-containing protein [Criibacterium bergeronii]
MKKLNHKTKSDLQNLEKRYSEIDTLFLKVYDDYAKSLLDEEKFKLVSQNYSNEQTKLKEKIKNLQTQIKETNKQEEGIDNFVTLIEQCLEIKELNAFVVNTLIDKVIVSEPKEINGEMCQNINIVYNFIGEL